MPDETLTTMQKAFVFLHLRMRLKPIQVNSCSQKI